ncbi:MAG: oligopeptide transport system permease protein [Planctomycetota bacterium]|jgi:oligopeptide transport system permease protein
MATSSKSDKSERWDLGGSDLEVLLEEAKRFRGESLWNDAWRRLKRNRSAFVSLLICAAILTISFLAPLWPLASPSALDLQLEPQPPVAPWTQFGRGEWSADDYWELSAFDQVLQDTRAWIFGDWQTERWMGTDSKGRDVMSRIIWGSRVSFQVSIVATLFSLLIGVTYGAFAGFMGGRIDNLMMRAVDVLYSIPFIFLVIFALTLISEYLKQPDSLDIQFMHLFYLLLGLIYWLTMARVVRGQVLTLKNSEFIEAARVMGASTARIIFAHLVPNVLSIVIVYLTLTIPAVMLFEAFISFLGLGVQAPEVSWGLLAGDSIEAMSPVHSYWWLVAWIAAAMGITLLALNILGDGLRDALDPKLRGKD